MNKPLSIGIKVGEQLARKVWNGWEIYTVECISPSGRISVSHTLNPEFRYILNPDLTLRGSSEYYLMQRMTPDIMDEIEKFNLVRSLESRLARLERFSLSQLKQLDEAINLVIKI